MKKFFKLGCGCAPITIGVIFILGGILSFFLFGGVFSLTCTRTQVDKGVCTYKAESILHNKERNFKLSEFKKIYISENKGIEDDDGNYTPTYCIYIETAIDKIAFTPYASGDLKPKEEIVKKVEAFFNNPGETELFVEQDDKYVGVTIAGVFIVIGVILLVISAITFFIINLVSQRFGR
jgi:hypothetical protein